MPSLEMGNNIYLFKKEIIEKTIPVNCIGNFAVGYINNIDMFVVCYVGRSIDKDLKASLISLIDANKVFTHFKFKLQQNDNDSYDLHCKNFHDFGGTSILYNKCHPTPPKNSILKCKYCNK